MSINHELQESNHHSLRRSGCSENHQRRDPSGTIGRSTVFYNIGSWRKKHADWFYDDLTALFSLLSRDKIKPVIEQRMLLEDARKAHELLEQGGAKGKIVLEVNKKR